MAMALYHDGLSKALARVERMDRAALLRVLDDLFGRRDGCDGLADDEVSCGVRRQLHREFEDRSDYQKTGATTNGTLLTHSLRCTS
jgi:hypothetical protein